MRHFWLWVPVVASLWGQGLVSGAPLTALTPNGLGTMVTPLPPQAAGTYYTISGGTVAGGNLFHSFSTFNLGTGDTADFNVTTQIANILTRVTGGPSNIDGTITSTNVTTGRLSSANLFLINPAGVMFTANAQVNLGGSFIVSTANDVKFSDGSIFYGDINHPIQDAGLSSAPASAFGFLTPTPQPISFAGSSITMQAGTGFHVIGGDISIDQGSPDGLHEQGATLLAPSGNLTLFSASSAGEVPFSLASPGSGFATAPFSAFGNITVRNQSSVAIDGAGGGSMVIRGGRIVVDNSTLSSADSGSRNGGNISLQADQLTLQNAGQIVSGTTSTGRAGDVSVQAGSADLDGSGAPSAVTGISSDSEPGATGNGGDVSVAAGGSLSILGGAAVESNTYSSGNAGKVVVQASSLLIDGSAAPGYLTGIISGSESGATGNGGEIIVTATGTLSIVGAGEIAADTFTSGDAGEVTVQAGSLLIDGSATLDFVTGIFSESDSSDVHAPGNAGSVTVTVDGALTLVGTGQIVTDTFTAGHAGELIVQAGSIRMDGSLAPDELTGITSNADSGTGRGGDVTVTATGAILIQGAAEISASTFSSGNAGEVTVQAGSLSIDGSETPGYFTGIASEALPQSSGASGAITVNVSNLLSVAGGGQISAIALSSGNAGEVTVRAGSLNVDGSAAPGYLTGITSDSESGASGNGGKVAVTASGPILIQGGAEIASDTYSSGNGGDVTVTSTGPISILSAGEITAGTFSTGNAGEVAVQAGSLLIDGSAAPGSLTGITSGSEPGATGNGGEVTVTATDALSIQGGGEIASNTFSSGNAGDVTVQTGSLAIDGTDAPGFLTGISSDSELGATGNGGDLIVTATGAISIQGGGEISAGTFSSGQSGEVTVQAGSLSVDGSSTPGYFAGIATNANNQASNNAGDVTVTVEGLISLTGGGEIASNTFSSGNAGEVTVRAGSITIDGSATPDFLTGIASGSNSDVSSSLGNAGTVAVSVAGALVIRGSGEIDVTTDTAGQGGDLLIQAGSITIDGSATPGSTTGLAAQATAAGDGGDLIVDATSVALSAGATISSSSKGSDAGNIEVNAAHLSLKGNSSIDTSAGVDGGTITLQIGGLVYLLDSQISTAAGGNGGNINIDPQFVVLDHSLISANAALGQGGNITILTDDFLNNDSQITATGTTAGTITISAPNLNLSGSLIALPATLESNEKRLRESCARSIHHEFSTFIVVGRGGTETAPEELQPDFGFDEFPPRRAR